jgi:putative transcriptional regulator
MSESLAGRLLVASPDLLDPNFRRTVVFMCSHDERGAFGIVLNRPLPALVIDHLPQWGPRVAWPGNLFGGGPVEPGVALALGLTAEPRHDPWWTGITEHIGLVGLGEDASEPLATLERVRGFGGYAGWGGGQLETEIAGESWVVVDARPDDPFTPEPERLWYQVLRRQRGPLAMYAFVPRDDAVN